jgi:hypothetical protein
MAQESEQKEWNWRAGATAVICREDQQPAGGDLEEYRLGAVLHRSIVSLTAATTDCAHKRGARSRQRRTRRGSAGQVRRGGITEELTCSRTMQTGAGLLWCVCVLATGVPL